MTVSAADAIRFLREYLESRRLAGGMDAVPTREPIEYAGYWLLPYDSRAYVESGDPRSAMAGNGPLVVPKDGREPFRLGTARSPEVQMAKIVARDAGPGPTGSGS